MNLVPHGHHPFDKQRVVHPSKPVWWVRAQNEDRDWVAIPHYGKRMTRHVPGKGWQ